MTGAEYDEVQGQIHTIRLLLLALLQTHPKPQDVRQVFLKLTDASYASHQQQAVADEFLASLERERDYFAGVLERLAGE